MRRARNHGTFCIYCKRSITGSSWEHVVPASIGGRLEVTGLLCATCNNAFSTSQHGDIDKVVHEQLGKFLTMLDLRTGRRKTAGHIRAVAEHQGVPFDLGPGMELVPGRGARRVEHLGDGQLQHRIVIPSDKVEETIAQLKKRYGGNVEIVETGSLEMDSGVDSVVDVMVGGPLFQRAVTKIAFSYHASRATWDIGCDGIFDDTREHVFNGTGDALAGWDYVNEFPAADLEPHQHDVAVGTDAVGTSIVGYVTLYGAVRFSTLLTPCYAGEPFGYALRCDAGAGVEELPLVSHHEYDFDVVRSHLGHWKANLAGFNAAVHSIVGASVKKQSARRLKGTSEEIVDALLASGGPDLEAAWNAYELFCKGESLDPDPLPFSAMVQRLLLAGSSSNNDHEVGDAKPVEDDEPR